MSLAEQPTLPLDPILESEAPILTNNPTGKPLVEMTDTDLAEWHARMTAHIQSPQTLLSHLKGPSVKKPASEPARDISKYD